MENVKGFLTVRQAARIAGVDSFTIYRWMWSGKLKALRKKGKQKKRWIIPNHALENLGKNRGEKHGISEQGGFTPRKSGTHRCP